MKINTISAYLLVYLLARGHWNLMVPVRAEVESEGSSGSASADAGSVTPGGDASSTVAEPAAPEGSSASPDAGLTGGDGSGHVAGSSADGASSGDASTVPEEHASVVELFTGGWTVDADSIANPVLVAKKEEAKLLAERTRKAAEELRKAADNMLKEAEDLDKVIKDTGVLEELTVKVETIAHKLNIDRSKAAEVAKPLDMTYYSGFPDGHHRYDAGADDLIERESNWANSLTYYSGFPDGHHNFDYDTLKEVRERDEVLTNNLMYYSGFPNGWHVRADFEVLERIYKEAIRVELKGVIDAKKKEIETFKKVILDLTTQMEKIETDVKNLEEEYNEYVQKMLGLDAALIKLYKADADGNPVEMVENTDFEKKKAHGDTRFEFKASSLCTLVKYGEHVLWNKGLEGVNEPKLVAFNGSMGLIAVRDNDRAVLFKKETNSDEWKHHNTVIRQRGTGAAKSASQTGSAAPPASGSLTTGLSTSKMNLEAGSTGTPESVASLNEDDKSSVASGEANEPNEPNVSESTAFRGSSEGLAEGRSSSGGDAASEYSSVFMD